MSDLGFDPRPYCERLAKAMPDRFQVTKYAFDYIRWTVHDAERPDAWFDLESEPRPLAMDLWAFFGPLADEWNIEDIRPYDLVMKRCERPYPTLLETIIAAVVESFEEEVKNER